MMPRELIVHTNSAYIGGMVTAQIYTELGQSLHEGIQCTPLGDTGSHAGDIPAGLQAGVYILKFRSGDACLATTVFNWDGSNVVSGATAGQIYDHFTNGSNADAFKADLTATNTAIASIPASVEVSLNDESDGIRTIDGIAQAIVAAMSGAPSSYWQGVFSRR